MILDDRNGGKTLTGNPSFPKFADISDMATNCGAKEIEQKLKSLSISSNPQAFALLSLNYRSFIAGKWFIVTLSDKNPNFTWWSKMENSAPSVVPLNHRPQFNTGTLKKNRVTPRFFRLLKEIALQLPNMQVHSFDHNEGKRKREKNEFSEIPPKLNCHKNTCAQCKKALVFLCLPKLNLVDRTGDFFAVYNPYVVKTACYN